MRKTTHLLAIPAALVLAAGLAACQDEVPVSSSDSSSSSSNSGSTDVDTSTEDTSAMDLAVGDCIADYGDTETVDKVPLVDCNAPHRYEVYYEGDITQSTYPTDDEMNEIGRDICLDSFKDYVGVDYHSSTAYDVTFYNPTRGSWASGDRTITCLIVSMDGTDLEGSAKDTAK